MSLGHIVVAGLVLTCMSCADGSEARDRNANDLETTQSSAPTSDPDNPPAQCDDVESAARDAFLEGVQYLVDVPQPRTDTVWILQLVAEDHPELGIDPVDGREVGVPSDPGRRLIGLEVEPRPPRSPSDDSAESTFYRDLELVFLPPVPATTSELEEFVSTPDLDAYALTHQWLAALLAPSMGHQVPGIDSSAKDLEAGVWEELETDTDVPDDLWAERVALLAHFGDPTQGPTPAQQDEWLCRAVVSQEEGGFWTSDEPYVQSYNGGTFELLGEPEHVTALTTLMLSALLKDNTMESNP